MAKDNETLAKRYAKALLDVLIEARGEKVSEDVEKQFGAMEMFHGGEAGRFFRSPVFDQKEKIEMLEKILSKSPVDPGLERFLKTLISLGQIDLLPEIVTAYSEALREHRNETQAKVRSAFPLSETEAEKISAALGRAVGKKVSMEVAVDPELIGGVVAEVGGVVYDASIQGYLQRLQEEFSV